MSAPLKRHEIQSDHPRNSLASKVGDALANSRYFALSVSIHLIIVALAGTIVLYKAYIEPDDFTASSDGIVSPIEELREPREQPADPLQPKVATAQPPPVTGQTLDVVTTIARAPSFPTPSTPVVSKLPAPADVLPNLGDTLHGLGENLPTDLRLRGSKDWRKLPPVRRPTAKSEAAVLRGLEWLRINQNEDGSWGDSSKPAMTGLALLCFLGHGDLTDSPQYGLTVSRAIQWLLENGTRHQGRLNMDAKFTQPGVYEHGICTYALGEYFAMTGDERVVELLRQAVAHIVQGQGSGGGWMYSYDKTANDLSVSGWQIQALKAAHLTKLNLPGVIPSLDQAVRYLDSVKGPKGGYGYRGPEDRYSLTGVGLLGHLFWKGERGELRTGMTWLLEETAKNKPLKYQGASADLYAWYYHTQACLMFGGTAWDKWRGWFIDEISEAQSPDGSWPVPGAKGHGPQSDPGRNGAAYRTTLCILMLEVFYRYMPTTQG